ncbi:MAG TPA: hypothetical protein VLB44_01170 [Kofleriaceae bacterium]|nr:hypothetical protein [Kofleriaceae bacterium]
MSECAACNRMPPRPGGVAAALARALGPRWWAVQSVGDACAELVVAVRREGLCERHAAWWATLARLRILSEARRRALVPGLVLVLYGEIPDEPYEPMAKRRDADDEVVLAVHRFVAGSPLAAVVEIDAANHRARVTLQIAGSDPLQTMQVESRRLEYLTAAEVFDGLRQRAALG